MEGDLKGRGAKKACFSRAGICTMAQKFKTNKFSFFFLKGDSFRATLVESKNKNM